MKYLRALPAGLLAAQLCSLLTAIAAGPAPATLTAGLHFAQSPANGDARALLNARQQLAETGFVSLELKPPLALYVVNGPGGLAAARTNAFVYPVLCFGTQVALIQLPTDPAERSDRNFIWLGDNEDDVTAALAQLPALDPVRTGAFEARLLAVKRESGRNVAALWLKSETGAGDYIYTLGPVRFPGKDAGKLYPAGEFLRSILSPQAAADDKSQRDAATLAMLETVSKEWTPPATAGGKSDATNPPPATVPVAPGASDAPAVTPPPAAGGSRNSPEMEAQFARFRADEEAIQRAAAAARAAMGNSAATLANLDAVRTALEQAATTLGGASKATHGGFVELGLDDLAQARAAVGSAVAVIRLNPAITAEPVPSPYESTGLLKELNAFAQPAGNPQPNMYHAVPFLKTAIEALQTVPGGDLGGAREKITDRISAALEDIVSGIRVADHANQTARRAGGGANRNAGPAPAVAGPTAPPAAGQPYTTALTGNATLDLVWIAPGSFPMGASPKQIPPDAVRAPPMTVTLTQGYWLGKFEVTQGQYEALIGSNITQVRRQVGGTSPNPQSWYNFPSHGVGPDLPVYYITREAALEFCRKLTFQERAAGRLPPGYEYTLPTSAQWEYACRAGTTTRYYNGDDSAKLDDIAWIAKEDHLMMEQPVPATPVHPVGQKQPNAWGLYDMLGNVMEWCIDTRFGSDEGYPGGAFNDFAEDYEGFKMLTTLRGGSVYGTGGSADRDSSSFPGELGSIQWGVSGFRVALAVLPRPPSVQTAPRPPSPVIFADPTADTTATQRLLTLQTALQNALPALKPAPTDPADGFVAQATTEVRQALDLVTAALAWVHAHPEADALPAGDLRVAMPPLGIPATNYVLEQDDDEEYDAPAAAGDTKTPVKARDVYPTLSTAMRTLYSGYRQFLLGGEPFPTSVEAVRRLSFREPVSDGPVIGGLGGFRDRIVRHLARASIGLNTGVEAFGGRSGFRRPSLGLPPASGTADSSSAAHLGSISGIVVDGDGSPLANAAISIRSMTGSPRENRGYSPFGQPPVTFSDALGRFTIADLPPGNYAITGELAGTRGDWKLSGSVGVPNEDESLADPSGKAGAALAASRPVEVRDAAETQLSVPLKLIPPFDF